MYSFQRKFSFPVPADYRREFRITIGGSKHWLIFAGDTITYGGDVKSETDREYTFFTLWVDESIHKVKSELKKMGFYK